jgi:uncharacterized membrane protein HdeD (DUF308 family)
MSMTGDQPMLGLDPITEEIRCCGSRWGHFLAFGIILILLGTLAIMYSILASVVVALALGIMLAVEGVVEIGSAFWARGWRGFFVSLLLGLLYLIGGVLMITRPLAAIQAITLVLAVFYTMGGAMRIAFAITHRSVGGGWVLLNGVITLILGIWIWSAWPWDSLWVIGLFVGIDMIFLGWSWVMLSFAVKPSKPAAAGQPT